MYYIIVNVKEVRFLIPVGYDCQRRHIHRRVGNKIIYFVVQFEIFINNRWYTIVRYDTAHGFAHRDIIHFDGKVDKMVVMAYDYNEALNIAESDLKANWFIYRERFLKEVKDNE